MKNNFIRIKKWKIIILLINYILLKKLYSFFKFTANQNFLFKFQIFQSVIINLNIITTTKTSME